MSAFDPKQTSKPPRDDDIGTRSSREREHISVPNQVFFAGLRLPIVATLTWNSLVRGIWNSLKSGTRKIAVLSRGTSFKFQHWRSVSAPNAGCPMAGAHPTSRSFGGSPQNVLAQELCSLHSRGGK